MVGNVVRPANSMSVGPWLPFICYEVSSLTRSSAVWNAMMVGEAFSKSTDDSFGSSIVCRKGKSMSKVSVYSNKNKMCPFHDRNGTV